MAKTFEYSMKIPFDMSDVNGFIKIPQLILLSLQVSGMQSIELGMSDMYILENYNLVWIITDYNMKIERLPVLMRNHYRNLCQESQSTFLLPGL